MKIEFQKAAILIGIAFLFCLSCKNATPVKTVELTCESIKQIKDKDQKLRGTALKSPFSHNLDSLIKIAGYEEGLDAMSDLDTWLLDSLRTESRALIKPYNDFQQRRIDSLWQVQTRIDSVNTLQIIAMIETFGLDSLNKIDNACDQNSLIVFVHTPTSLMKKVRDVINANKDGIGENRFRHISWHLDGRK